MGSHAELLFRDKEVSSYGSFVPLELFLMFDNNCLVKDIDQNDDGEDYETYQFVTTVGEAGLRLDNKGLTFNIFKNLYEEYKSKKITRYKDDKLITIENNLSYEKFCAAIKRYEAKAPKFGMDIYKIEELFPDDYEILVAFDEDMFVTESEVYLDEVGHLIYIRALFEVFDKDDKIILDITSLVHGGYYEKEEVDKLYDMIQSIMLRRINLDYQIYGYLLKDDPQVVERLKQKIMNCNEDDFLKKILKPLLVKLNYEDIKIVNSHGRNEFGSDILPFRYKNQLGFYEYYALQAKVVKIHGISAQEGNAGEIISQAIQAFAISFIDSLDNERKKIDKYFIATNKEITPDAKRVIEEAIEKNRSIIFLDIDKIVELIKSKDLASYVLFYD
jgi:hypothetical protein